MAQKFQITQVAANGSTVVMHPESNADLILTGVTYKIPTIANISDWNNKSTEIVNARKGEPNLKAKIDKIDTSITPAELLKSIKTVDGINSGLDADKVDGCDLNDNTVSTTGLWTSNKIQTELNKKLNETEVVGVPAANKILKLNGSGVLPASITGNANTATSLAKPVSLKFDGDVNGIAVFDGKEASINIDMQVKDNSHSHSSIDGVSVNDNEADENSLWTALKTSQEISAVEKSLIGLIDNLTEVSDGEIRIGSLKVKYGTVGVAGKEKVSISFKTAFDTLLFNGHSCETSDLHLVATIVPKSLKTTGIEFNLNKKALDGNLIWFAVGV